MRRWFSASSVRDNIRVADNVRMNIVFGANTDVGKTIVSAGLVRSALAGSNGSVHYIKPLQSGGSDEDFVRHHTQDTTGRFQGDTLFRWQTPASPHTVSVLEDLPASDREVLAAVRSKLAAISNAGTGGPSTTIVETAGGVLTPAASSPSNTAPSHSTTAKEWGWKTQADLYQPILGAAPVVLVGDGRLGGISATLSSLESLLLRGYDVAGLMLLENGYDNLNALREYASR